jgi:hypothetical protein
VEREDEVPAKSPPRNAHVTNYDDKSPARRKDPIHVLPYEVELAQEILIIVEMAELVSMLLVPL